MKKIILLLTFFPMHAMAMGDNMIFHSANLELDYGRQQSQDVLSWDGSFWVGGDYDKLVIRTIGEQVANQIENNELRVYYSRYIDHFWDARIGIRQDMTSSQQPELAAAINGLAPYYIETNLVFFANQHGQLHGELELAHTAQLTQKLVAEPYLNTSWRGVTDTAELLGTGISQYEIGMQLRYEFNRHFALFLDCYNSQSVGSTKFMRNLAGAETGNRGMRTGVRLFNF